MSYAAAWTETKSSSYILTLLVYLVLPPFSLIYFSLVSLYLFLASQVKDDLCDYPCSPDKSYCFVYACCGSRDGAYYTVAFAGQVRVYTLLLSETEHLLDKGVIMI